MLGSERMQAQRFKVFQSVPRKSKTKPNPNSTHLMHPLAVLLLQLTFSSWTWPIKFNNKQDSVFTTWDFKTLMFGTCVLPSHLLLRSSFLVLFLGGFYPSYSWVCSSHGAFWWNLARSLQPRRVISSKCPCTNLPPISLCLIL